MKEQKTTGLTLGKFAPFHRGHQFVIDTALREMDEVIVLIYDCPEITDIPLSVRAGWIRSLYPAVQVIEAWGGPAEVGCTTEIEKIYEDFLQGFLKGKAITHFYSSEPYGEQMSAALGAVNRQVDPDRVTVPVSASMLRNDTYTYKHYLDPVVYRDHIMKVVLLGAPSTGKTTLAGSLAERFSTVWMPEYGREYWEQHQVERKLTQEQLAEIAQGHLEREDIAALESRELLIVDTNAITTYIFSLYYHGEALPRLKQLAEAAAARYDLVLVCDKDFTCDNTWDRSEEVHRDILQKQILADLKMRKVPYFLLSGSLEERLEQAESLISKMSKYKNLGDLLVE